MRILNASRTDRSVFYGKTHNFLILLNRQRVESYNQVESGTSNAVSGLSDGNLRGRERVLTSARCLLHAFEFFHTRVRVAMICWTMGQQAFNASMILTLSLLNPVPTSAAAAEAARNDYYLVHRTYGTFVEMHQKGIHKLAGVACSKLSALLMQLHPPPSSTSFGLQPQPADAAADAVMGNTGMVLLEDPGLQGFVDPGFAPLGFQMAGSDLAPQATGIGSPGWAARGAPADMGLSRQGQGQVQGQVQGQRQHGQILGGAPSAVGFQTGEAQRPAVAQKPEMWRMDSASRA